MGVFLSKASGAFQLIQRTICEGLERLEPSARFRTDEWDRTDLTGSHGGGGKSRILVGGEVFEQAGVNFSEVSGTLPADMTERLIGSRSEAPFIACGTSLVIHPRSPLVPTVHMNVRALQVGEHSWCGGGSDLTPSYLFEDDCAHFHQTLKSCCNRFNPGYYPRFKAKCDEYFYLPHRKETRGIGGIFFDYLGKDEPESREHFLEFTISTGNSFLDSYLPIVMRRKDTPFTDAQRQFQLYRRGRYVEFNLVYDRGTLFGLRTHGRAESILMSLPPFARWEYAYEPAPNSPEAAMLTVLRAPPREWVL